MNNQESHHNPRAIQLEKQLQNTKEPCQSTSFFLDISQSYLDESQLMNSIHNDPQNYSQMHTQKASLLTKELFTIKQSEAGQSGSKSIFDEQDDDEALLLSSIKKASKVLHQELNQSGNFDKFEEDNHHHSENQANQQGEKISQISASSNFASSNENQEIKAQTQSKTSMANSIESSFKPHLAFDMRQKTNQTSSKYSIDSSMLADMVPLEYLDDKESKINQKIASVTSQISKISISSEEKLINEKEVKDEEIIEQERTLDSINQNMNALPIKNNSQSFINSIQEKRQVLQSKVEADKPIKQEQNNKNQSIKTSNIRMPCSPFPFSQITVSFNNPNEVTMKFNQSKENFHQQSASRILTSASKRKQIKDPKSNCYQKGVQTSPPIQKIQRKASFELKQSSKITEQYIKNAEKAEQWIEFKADIYLNNPLPTEQDHLKFESELVPYIFLLFQPKPRNLIGEYLFKNGLVLNAMVKLITRPVGSPFILNHLYKYLSELYPIAKNKFVFDQQLKKAKANFEHYLDQKYRERRNLEIQQDVVKRRSIKQSNVQSVFPTQKVNSEQQTKVPNLRLGSIIYTINQNIKAERPINILRQDIHENKKAKEESPKQEVFNAPNANQQLMSSKVRLLKSDNTLLIISDRLKKEADSLANQQDKSPRPNIETKTQQKRQSKQSAEQKEKIIYKDLYERYKLIRETRKSETKPLINRETVLSETKSDLSQSNINLQSKASIKPAKKVQFVEDEDSSSTVYVIQDNNKNKNKKKGKKTNNRYTSADESEAQSISSRRPKPKSKR